MRLALDCRRADPACSEEQRNRLLSCSGQLLRADDDSAGTTAAFLAADAVLLALTLQPHALSASWHRLCVDAVTSHIVAEHQAWLREHSNDAGPKPPNHGRRAT
jgi:hypothetical protein